MKIKLLTLLILSSLISKAQYFEKIFSFSTGSNTNEYANAAITLSNGNYLVGINNRILCLSPNGDSLWSKTYAGYGDVAKLLFNFNNELLLATTKGKMTILKIDPNNGDSIGNIFIPGQIPNSGYTIYDMLILPNNDIVYCYNNGGSYGGIITRFTPGASVNVWSNDYANQNWGPRNILLDDSTLVIAGYKGTSGYTKLVVQKLGISNSLIWSKELHRGTYYADRKLGIMKNLNGQYLVATSFNMFSILAPTVVKLSNSGDSLSSSWVNSYHGKVINHGYITSISPTINGYFASGYINYNKNNPDNVEDGMGHMTVFFVNSNGEITQAKAYNKVGFYQFGPGSGFEGAEAWGNGCISNSTGKYLLYGVGNRIFDPGTGANYQAQWRGYVVQSDSMETVSGMSQLYQTASNYIIYPNPVNDILTINNVMNEGNTKFQIINLFGAQLDYGTLDNPNEIIDFNGFVKGIYFVKLINNNNSQTIKIIKQ